MLTLLTNDDDRTLARFVEEEGPRLHAELLRAGAVLLRGFGVDSDAALQTAMDAFGGAPLDYIDGNSPRTKLSDKVYTSTEHPADVTISLHSELSYAARWPSHLFFCCEVAPDADGNTTVADNRRILAALPDGLVDEFRAKGVRYVRNLHGGLGAGPSWQATFETDDRAAVEAICRNADTDATWNGDELRLVQHRPAIRPHPATGEECWFNQADQFHPSTNPADVYEALVQIYRGRFDEMPQHATFGDGTEIPDEALAEIRRVSDEAIVLFPWVEGDLLVIDNLLCAHGRSPYQGPRRILVGMKDIPVTVAAA